MKTTEQLRAEIAPLQAQINKIETAKRTAESRALLGKCFKYRNNYSVPEKPSDYWWLYLKVTKAGYWTTTFEFQTDKYGHISIKTNDCAAGIGAPGNGYVAITAKEFNAAWKALQRRVAGMNP